MKKRFAAVLCILLLFSQVTALAAFPDLPESHWAYNEIQEAITYRVMNGLSDGRMVPNDTLTWAQYLAMLSRAFASDAYWDLVQSGTAWDEAAWQTAWNSGILLSDDFLDITRDTIRSTPISRQDVAVLLSRVLSEEEADRTRLSEGTVYVGDGYYLVTNAAGRRWFIYLPNEDSEYQSDPGPDAAVLTDFYQMDENRQEAVRILYRLEVIRGKTDGSFGPRDTIRRCDGGVLLIRTLDYVDRKHDGESRAVNLTFLDETGRQIGRTVSANSYVGQSLASLANANAPNGYGSSNLNRGTVSVASAVYTLYLRPMTAAER